jgi:spore germination protein KC
MRNHETNRGSRFQAIRRLLQTVLLFTGCSLCLAGCWDRLEVNDIAIVSGTAIDWEEGHYRLSVQFPLASQIGGAKQSGGGGSGVTWYMDSGTGRTIREAHNDVQRSVSRKLYYAHRRVILFGEEAARSGTKEMIDIVARIPENRITTMVFVADGKAADILSVESPLEQSTADLIQEIGVYSAGIPRTLKHYIDSILSDGVEAVVPYVGIRETEPGEEGKSKPGVTMKGMALFRDDRMVGTINAEKSRTFLWVINQAQTSEATVKLSKYGYVTLMFQETESALRPKMVDGDVEMDLIFKARALVMDNESTYSSVTDELRLLREETERMVKHEIQELVTELKEKHNTDAIGFGDAIYRKYPARWRELRDVWYEYAYRRLPVHVNVNIQIETPGTIIKPIGQEDRDNQ